GYAVTAFDASPQLVQLASEYTGLAVKVRSFSDVNEQACYDGIWACASLLHLPLAEMPGALGKLWNALKPGGAFYFSFKLGDGERQHGGRRFTDANEQRLHDWLGSLPELHHVELWRTADQRPDRADQWINA